MTSDLPASATATGQLDRSPGLRLFVLLLGLWLPQVLLLGSALTGARLLLPLDLLEGLGSLPSRPEFSDVRPHDVILSDLVVVGEPSRLRLGEELRHGRFNLTNPYCFCGGPAALEPKLSLASIFGAVFSSPVSWAWLQVLTATLAGTGLYLFSRQTLGVSFWAACGVAWCYPLTGFFVFWQGYGLDFAAAWFPWLMVAVWNVVRAGRTGWWLLLITASQQLIVTRLDLAGHALLAGGAWAVYLLFAHHGYQLRPMVLPAIRLGCAWAIAFALAAPQILPSIEYAKTGVRTVERAEGVEERPPIGPSAAILVVSPFALGSTHRGSLFLLKSNIPETAACYSGLVIALALAPLAWSDRRQRWLLWFFVGLAVVGLGWLLNVPLLVSALRLPIVNLFSHNRFTFVATFALYSLASMGLNRLLSSALTGRSLIAPVMLLLAMALWSGLASLDLPDNDERMRVVENARDRGEAAIRESLRRFDLAWERISDANLVAAGWASAAVILLILVVFSPRTTAACGGLLGLVALVELLCIARTARPLVDPALYYPKLAVLERLDRTPNERVLGIDCLPPRLLEVHGLRDIRGYDAVDPRLLIELLDVGRDRRFKSPEYARTLAVVPLFQATNSGDMRLHPVMSLLGVTRVITRGPLPEPFQPVDQAEGFCVYRNVGAISRAFIPESIRQASREVALQEMEHPEFNPLQVAYVDETAEALHEAGRGTAEVIADGSNFVRVRCRMQKAGLVVISDLWAAGWTAHVNGAVQPVIRVDHALRGVVVPQGDVEMELTYIPSSVKWGMLAAAMGLVAAILGALVLARWGTTSPISTPPAAPR